VLVTGAAGGVGSFAITLLSKLGFTVVASTGRMAEADYLKKLGAAEVIDRATLSAPGKPLAKERWAAVVDSVGSYTLANACAQTKSDGAVAACGLAQGMDFPSSVAPFILRAVTLYGINSVTVPRAKRITAYEQLSQLLDLKTLDEISLYLENRKFPQSVTMNKLNDTSKLTRNRIKLVLGNALLGFILVNVILFLTFDIKTAFWTAFGIPFSMMGCMIFLYLTNSSLNMFVLGGFILVVGMLVDDAIVISDSINSYIEKGLTSIESAKEGVNDVWLPVLASSTTTMAAFTPLMSLGGLPGKFIWIIPAIVILCLIISLFESYFLLPVHLAHFSSKRTERKKVMTKLENYYEKLLRKVLQQKKLFLIFTILLFMITIFIANKYIKKDPFPQDASEGFIINVSLEKGSDLDKTEGIVKEIHKYVSKLPKTELLGITARVGTNSETTTLERGSISNSAVIFVYLTSFELRKRNGTTPIL
jgi:multidrug efflux pump subunit AcrB